MRPALPSQAVVSRQHGRLSKVLCKRILPIISFLVFEKIKIGVEGCASYVLASQANEGAGEAGKSGRGGFIGQNAGVKLLWEPLPVAASFYTIGKVQTFIIHFDPQMDWLARRDGDRRRERVSER